MVTQEPRLQQCRHARSVQTVRLQVSRAPHPRPWEPGWAGGSSPGSPAGPLLGHPRGELVSPQAHTCGGAVPAALGPGPPWPSPPWLSVPFLSPALSAGIPISVLRWRRPRRCVSGSVSQGLSQDAAGLRGAGVHEWTQRALGCPRLWETDRQTDRPPLSAGQISVGPLFRGRGCHHQAPAPPEGVAAASPAWPLSDRSPAALGGAPAPGPGQRVRESLQLRGWARLLGWEGRGGGVLGPGRREAPGCGQAWTGGVSTLARPGQRGCGGCRPRAAVWRAPAPPRQEPAPSVTRTPAAPGEVAFPPQPTARRPWDRTLDAARARNPSQEPLHVPFSRCLLPG